ncbi:MAG TPA: anti-sigma factor, partial [Jatrophihabitans sp.]|nr:anti-sigma factor [Jatrophihabitans sp.]
DCQHELVSAVVAHASLTSAYRFARPVIAPPSEVATADEDGDGGPVPLPDLSDLFAQVRADAAPAAAPAQHPHRRRWIAAGIAAAVVAGGGITAGVVASQSEQPSGRTVALAPYDIGTRAARLTISGSTMKIDASKLKKLGPSQVYEVWLTDNPRKNLAAIGTLGTDNTATLTVAPAVRSHYTHVEVSVQKASNLQFSGISVLRGDYG